MSQPELDRNSFQNDAFCNFIYLISKHTWTVKRRTYIEQIASRHLNMCMLSSFVYYICNSVIFTIEQKKHSERERRRERLTQWVQSSQATKSIKRHKRFLLVAYMQSRAHTHSLGTIHHSHLFILFAKMFKRFVAFFFFLVWFGLCSFKQTAIYSHSSDAFVAVFNLLHRFHIIVATWRHFFCSYTVHILCYALFT